MTLLDANKSENQFGEDTCELFEIIEQSFGVDLGDYKELAGKTVSEIAEEIRRKTRYPDSEKCLSAAAFYVLRQAFENLFGIPRTNIHPATHVDQLLPWKSRETQWKRLDEYLDVKLNLLLPTLAMPAPLFFACLFGPAVLLISLKRFCGLPLGALEIVLWSFVLIIPAFWAANPLARNIPSNIETFGDLSKVVLARNYSNFAKRCGSSHGHILSSLRQLIADVTVRNPNDVYPGTRIVDLNIY